MEWYWILTIISTSFILGFMLNGAFGKPHMRGCTIIWIDEKGFWAVRSGIIPPVWHNGAPIDQKWIAHFTTVNEILPDNRLMDLYRSQEMNIRRGE